MISMKYKAAILAAMFPVASFAITDPTDLSQIITGAPALTDDGSEMYEITDSDGVDDNMETFIFQELAGNRGINEFGLYELGNTANRLTVFAGADGSGTSMEVQYNAGTFTTLYGSAAFGPQFGVYLDSSAEGIFYSQTSQNSDGFDHLMAFDSSAPSVPGAVGLFDYIFAFEDLNCPAGACDRDFNDLVIGMTDVRAVPLPAAAWLFGSGLIGLAGVARRKKQS